MTGGGSGYHPEKPQARFKEAKMTRNILIMAICLHLAPANLLPQESHRFQVDFPPEEFSERRGRVFEKIGDQAMAILQGAPNRGSHVFRQTNSFYYLSGIEVPHAYLLMDGRNRRTFLYLPHRDERTERSEGKTLSVEDADLVKELTGVDDVFAIETLGRHFMDRLFGAPFPALYTPLSPAEGQAQSRDEMLTGMAGSVADPWDGRPSREGHFVHLLRTRYPQFEIRDLTPILDRMRIVKSSREIDLIRRASELAGFGIMEAIKSTEPGLYEYQLDAAARYVFLLNGSLGEGYLSITATGTNAFFGHYYRNDSQLKDGDLVLMDYAPDYRYYTSDVARIWPVNGRFSESQRQLYDCILQYYKTLLAKIRPTVTASQIMDESAEIMGPIIDQMTFSKDIYEKACRDTLTFRGHLSHPVGMAVHDVGSYRGVPLQPGTVFSIDPMLWVPEERLYVRLEDVVVVTENGVETFTWFVPSEIEDIEKLIAEEGVIQKVPPATATMRR
jgi:Xaa-Pro aminopeptidase